MAGLGPRIQLLTALLACAHAVHGAGQQTAMARGMGSATPLALVAESPQANPLLACIDQRLAAAGQPAVPADRLASGLEARLAVHDLAVHDLAAQGLPTLLATVSLSLKPAGDFMVDNHGADDPEAHPEVVRALLAKLRIPVVTQAWKGRGEGALASCAEMADWLMARTRQPVRLDHK